LYVSAQSAYVSIQPFVMSSEALVMSSILDNTGGPESGNGGNIAWRSA
jgi:hypothetical protein